MGNRARGFIVSGRIWDIPFTIDLQKRIIEVWYGEWEEYRTFFRSGEHSYGAISCGIKIGNSCNARFDVV